ARATSETVIQPELHQPGADPGVVVILRSNLPKVIAVHVLIVDEEIRVIQQIVEIRVQLQSVALVDFEVLRESEIIACETGGIQNPALERSQGAGLGIEEHLTREGRGAVRGYALRVGTDVRRIDPVRAVAGHEKSRDVAE